MSELIQKQDNRATIRWKLLTGVSALALTAYVSSNSIARADDISRPQIWIELGGQLSRLEDAQEAFAPNFPNSPARPSIFTPSQKFERPPLYSLDEFGGISFQPEGSDWIFSASIRYGRSASHKNVRQQTHPKGGYTTRSGVVLPSVPPIAPKAARFSDTNASNSEHHFILDFQAGKEVGLGMFGAGSSSVVSLGARFARFGGKSNIALKSDPDFHFGYKYNLGAKYQIYHSNAARLTAERSFHGIGPSLSWNASAPFAGDPQGGELSLDWGLNAAALFGRQRTKVHHQATGQYAHSSFLHSANDLRVTYQPTPVNRTRSRNVTVPNVGGFAGLSFRYADAKVSFGYRADMFFGAIDGGIDTRKNENRAFYGPFASVSVGLGD